MGAGAYRRYVGEEISETEKERELGTKIKRGEQKLI